MSQTSAQNSLSKRLAQSAKSILKSLLRRHPLTLDRLKRAGKTR